MNNNDALIAISGVLDKKKFFAALLEFYAELEVVLTVWGKVPQGATQTLEPFRAPTSWPRKMLFREFNFNLTPDSISALTHALCREEVLEGLTWGLLKDSTLLGLARSWDDMSFDPTEHIPEPRIMAWVSQLEQSGIIGSYEKVKG